MKIICTMSIGLLGLLGADASAETVLAPVVEATGTSSGAASGSAKPGANLAVGDAISTKSSSRVSFAPFPGALISLAAKTQASIASLDLDKQGGAVSRHASIGLKEGTVFFSVDQVNWDTTKCEISTPGPKVVAQRPDHPQTATVGIVSAHKGEQTVTIQVGKGACELANGKVIAINGGAVLTGNKDGFAVADLTKGEVTSYDRKGSSTGTHTASASELKTASGVYSKATELSQSLVAAGAVSPSVAMAVSETLTTVNQQLATLGVDPVNTESVGSLPSGAPAVNSPPSLAGLAGAGGANPANVKGLVRSAAQ